MHDQSPPTDAVASILAVAAACAAADGVDPLDEAAHLRLKHHGLTGSEHRLTAGGFALRHAGEVTLAVAPEARGQGLGRTLAAWAAAAPGPAAAWAHGDHPAAAALAARFGFSRARELWVMRRAAVVPLPPLELPPDVRIRTYRPSDEPALLAVNAAAFAAHPEQGALDSAGLAERMAEPWFDPAGLLLAVDDTGQLLGFHWTKLHEGGRPGERQGEVYVVAVSPAAQGRGLGRLLTLAGLHHLASVGAGEVHLYVESDNAPARATYERLGFRHLGADTHVHYVRAGIQSHPSQQPQATPPHG